MKLAVFFLMLNIVCVSSWIPNIQTTINICPCGVACIHATCTYHCNMCGRKRRSEEDIPKDSTTLLLPCKFEAWDLNKDGFVNLEEFAFTGHAMMEDRHTTQLFNKIDKNDDGLLTREELNSAPLIREKC